MSAFRKPVLVFALAGLAILALTAGGCRKKAPVDAAAIIGVPTQTVEATSSAPDAGGTPAVATGPITKPASGSELRTALLDAARAKFNTTSQFRIHQLWSQGNTAIGELEQITGGTGRVYIAWTGPNWTVVWSGLAGGTGVTKAAAAAALPTFSAEMLSKITWAPQASQPTQTQTPPAEDEASVLAKLEAAAQGWANSVMAGAGKPYEIVVSKVAKDSSGVWWGVVYVQPTADDNNSYEGLEFWCKYSGGAWTGQVQDPEPPDPATFFPKAIVEKLQL